MRIDRFLLVPKKPIPGRFFALLLVLVSIVPAASGEALTIADVTRLVLADPDRVAMINATVGAAQGALASAETLPNPVLQYQREAAGGLGGRGSENFAQVQQQLDLAGRRALAASAARSRVAAAHGVAESERVMAVVAAGERFYAAVAAERRLALVGEFVGELDHLEDLTALRATAGDASRYDLERVRQEAGYGPAEIARARSEVFSTRTALGALLGGGGISSTAELVGELLPPEPMPSVELISLAERGPRLAALAATAEAAEDELRAASRVMPPVTVGAGVRAVEGTGTAGLVFSVNVPLPVFDRNQGEIERTAALASDAAARHVLERRELLARIESLAERSRALRDAALGFRAARLDSADELERIAKIAYRAGEISVLEAIDALRSAHQAGLRLIDLELEARRAHLELRTLLPEEPQ